MEIKLKKCVRRLLRDMESFMKPSRLKTGIVYIIA